MLEKSNNNRIINQYDDPVRLAKSFRHIYDKK